MNDCMLSWEVASQLSLWSGGKNAKEKYSIVHDADENKKRILNLNVLRVSSMNVW